MYVYKIRYDRVNILSGGNKQPLRRWTNFTLTSNKRQGQQRIVKPHWLQPSRDKAVNSATFPRAGPTLSLVGWVQVSVVVSTTPLALCWLLAATPIPTRSLPSGIWDLTRLAGERLTGGGSRRLWGTAAQTRWATPALTPSATPPPKPPPQPPPRPTASSAPVAPERPRRSR